MDRQFTALDTTLTMPSRQDNPETLRKLLQQTPLFGALQPTELDAILAGTRRVELKAGTTLFRAGDPCTGFYIVVYGGIKVIQASPTGTERVIRLISPGNSFGEALMFLQKDYIVSAAAIQDTLVLHIGRATLLEELARNALLATKMLASLSYKLYMLVGDMGAYTMHNGTQRLIGYILREFNQTKELSFRINVNKKIIASRLNLTPERFSRILRELDDKKLLRVRGRVFTILDLEGLKTYQ
ncbi:MAG: Crp/Fnr family transcriptional regulator [Burkholderiaceae bacterium]|nr:MAG: Crp/Fnr family transcriptional regulator [Burkholderiaceae bacterium]